MLITNIYIILLKNIIKEHITLNLPGLFVVNMVIFTQIGLQYEQMRQN